MGKQSLYTKYVAVTLSLAQDLNTEETVENRQQILVQIEDSNT